MSEADRTSSPPPLCLPYDDNFQPAWIYDPKTLAFLEVNRAAMERYGYSREEFLAMTLKDIRPREDIPALLDRVANFESGRHTSGEWRHLWRDGSIRFVEVQSYDTTFDSRPVRLAVINDVTERHLAEEALKKTIQDYRGLFENAHDAILIVTADADGRVLDVNQHACQLYGYSRAEFLAIDIPSISKDPNRTREHIASVLSRPTSYAFDAVHVRKDGSEMFLEINASVVTYQNQQAILIINRDVTERKRTEEKMREHEQRRRLQVQRTPLGVIDWDRDFHIRAWNPAAEKIFGFSADEAIGCVGPELILPDDAKPHVAEIWAELRSTTGGLRSTNKNVTKDGRTIRCEWYNTPLVDANGEFVGATSLVQDVTTSEISRNALQDSEQRYRALAEAVPAIVYSSAPSSGVTDYYNRRWYDYTGMSEADSLGDKWAQAIHPDDLEPLIAEWKRCGDEAEPCEVEFRLRGADGQYRWFLSRSIPMRDESGAIVRWIGTSTDIDQIKRAQSELQRQKEILQTIFDHIPVMVSFFDSDGRYALVNRAWQATLGYTEADAISRDLLPELYPDPQELKRTRDFIRAADGKTWADFPSRTKDGRVLDTSFIDIPVPGGTIIGLGLDVTERRAAERKLQQSQRELEARLRQHADELNQQVQQRTERIRDLERQRTESEKLVATGRMAARVAHEINNPLAGISNAFDIIKKSIPTEHKYFSYVGLIDREVQRITNIVRQMYELYRPETERPHKFDLRAVLRETIALATSKAAERKIAIDLADDEELQVCLPESAIRQIMLNLIRNAIEASLDGGMVRVKLARAGKDQVIVTVNDRGKGIDPEIRDQLFEPFVTSKSSTPSAGLGLGLSISHSLARSMGGNIDFECDPAREGTTFRVTLPIAMEERDRK